MKKTVFLIFILLFSFSGFSQNFDMNDALPLNKDVRYGKLDNGLTYYVLHNEEPQNRAYLQLVVNAGSVLEDEDQKGLAHMCEHMAFNGTKNFPKHQLVSFLESLGMQFGADLNAYTSFDETVYMIEVPLDSAGYMTKGLQVIYDWACNVSYDTDEVNNERGVIYEEWRVGHGSQDRLNRQIFPAILYNSFYEKRLPIGDTNVFMNCPPDNLRKFYKDWYRPDLQAVVVVGDFDADKVVDEVKKMFSKIPVRTNVRDRIYPEVPDHDKTIVKVATDLEAPYTLVSIYIKNDFTTVGNYNEFKNELVEKLAVGMLNMRFNDIKQKPDAPFAYVGVGNGQFLGKKNAFNFYALPKAGKLLDAVKIGTQEILRAKKFGYTQSELDREKNVLLSGMKKQFDDRNKISSDRWASALHANFSVSQDPALNIEHEYKLYQSFLTQITLDDVNKAIKLMVIDKNTVIAVTAPDGIAVSEDEILDVFNNAKTAELTPYEEEEVADNLIAKEPIAGTVVSEQKDDVTGTTTWVLSNGIKVVFKQTDFKDNQILMRGYSYGGYSMYPNDIFSAKYAASIADNSGVGVFNSSQLTKYMSDKNVSCSPFVDLLTEGFSGNSTIDDFPTMMKLLYLYFTAPRFDDDAFQTFIQTEATLLANKANNPQAIWRDSLMANLYNHNPFMASLSLDNIAQIDKKRAEQIYKERFADPASFTFVFVGNIDLDKVKPQIEKYLASLPSANNNEKMNKIDLLLPEKTKKVYAKKGSDPKSVVYTIFSGTTKQSLKNQIYLKAISLVMTDSLLDQIRETKRWTYSISARSSFKSISSNQYTIGVYYSSSPENVDKVNEAIVRIADNFGQVEIPEEQLNKTIEKLKREYESNIRDNNYWLSELLYIDQTNGKTDFVTDYMDIVNSLNQKSIKKAAKKLINDYYLSVVLAPEE